VVAQILKRIAQWLAIAAVLVAPLAAWALIKPLRVIAPQWAGVQCYAGGVCTDAPERAAQATALTQEAVRFVQTKVGPIERMPPMVFCASRACEQSFGFHGSAAYSVGSLGVVVSMRGWQPHYVRHELIHHVQAEHLGNLRRWLVTPPWFVEGMAYALSDDPRHPLSAPVEGHRVRYEQWAAQVPAGELWSRAAGL
jgi:hypothetical protein